MPYKGNKAQPSASWGSLLLGTARCVVKAMNERLLVSCLLAASVTLWGQLADAEVRTCIENHESAQRLQRQGKVIAARELFGSCATNTCPVEIAKDCAQRFEKVGDVVPTIVLAAQDRSGKDSRDAEVLVDGKAPSYSITGVAIELEPGPHDFEFWWPDGSFVSVSILLREGEKNRMVVARQPNKQPSAAPKPQAKPPLQKADSQSNWPYILGGFGLAALGGFTYFAVSGSSREGCKPSCSQSEVDAMRTDYLLADISLGVALVSLGAGTYLYFAPPSLSPEDGQQLGRYRLSVGGQF